MPVPNSGRRDSISRKLKNMEKIKYWQFWKQALLLDLAKVNVPVKSSGPLLSTEFTAVLGLAGGRWKWPLWHALPSLFPLARLDRPGARTASEAVCEGWMVCPCVPGTQQGQATPWPGVLPVWAQHGTGV